MIKIKIIVLAAMLLFGEGSLFPVNAQEQSSVQNVDCFDYYQFGSIQLNFIPDKIVYQAGDKIKFKIAVQNQNNYPVVGGSIYAKIYRKNNSENHHVLSDDLVEAAYLQKNISLDAKATKEFDYVWETDQSFAEGEYQIRGYFNVADQYNLAGLPFYDINYSGSGDFEIKNAGKKSFYLNKDSVKVNGEKFNFNAYPPRVEASQEIEKVEYELVNPEDAIKRISLTYNLFSWDTVNQKNLIKSETKQLSLAAGATQSLNYEFPIGEHAVYDLQVIAQAEKEEAKSIIEVRTSVLDGAKEARINFPALTKFPLKKGEQAELFTCYHATGDFEVENGKIVVDLLDSNNKVIKTLEYAKPISGEMSAVKTGFTAPNDLEKAKIRARYYQDGKMISETELNYDCQKINPSKCLPKSAAENESSSKTNRIKYLLLAVGFLLAATVIVVLSKTFNKNKDENNVE